MKRSIVIVVVSLMVVALFSAPTVLYSIIIPSKKESRQKEILQRLESVPTEDRQKEILQRLESIEELVGEPKFQTSIDVVAWIDSHCSCGSD